LKGGKKYYKYFDLATQTVRGKPTFIFSATEEVESIYVVKSADKQKLLERAKSLVAEANADFARGSLWPAVKRYRGATALAPFDAGAHSRLGYALLSLGLCQEALQPLSRALFLDSDQRLRSLILDNIGMAKSKLGDQIGAISSFGLALALRPRDARFLVHRGVSLERAGQHDNAYTDALVALKLRPGYEPALRLKDKLETSGHISPIGAANCSEKWQTP
jgi:Flp pilus assembly protein TadD